MASSVIHKNNLDVNLRITFAELLPDILNNLTTQDLLTCRLVDREWREVTDKILLKRKAIQVTFTFCPHRKMYIIKSNRKSVKKASKIQEKSLTNFNKFLLNPCKLSCRFSKSWDFPCTQFRFEGGNLGVEEAQAFFNEYGPFIEGLSVGPRTNQEFPPFLWDVEFRMRKTCLLNIIFKQLPNLESLIITDFPRWEPVSWLSVSSTMANFEEISLPQLKSLEIGGPFSHSICEKDTAWILGEILPKASNCLLSTISFKTFLPSLKLMPIFVKTATISRLRIKSLCWFMTSDEPPELLELEILAKCEELGLEELMWVFVHPPSSVSLMCRIIQALLKIIEKNKRDLKTLNLATGSLILLTHMPLPRLTNVKELTFDFTPGLELRDILPPDYFDSCSTRWSLLSSVFPCLHTIRINDADKGMDKWFPFTHEKLPTVKILEIHHGDSSEYAGQLIKMFPFLETLIVGNIKNFTTLACHIWNSRELKVLDLTIDLSDLCEANSFPYVDAAFLGLTVKTVKLLSELLESGMNIIEDVEKLRVNPSILHLKKLNTLSLCFRDVDEQIKDSYKSLTEITAHFGFNLMPDVCVEFSTAYSNRVPGNGPTLARTLRPLASACNNVKVDANARPFQLFR